MSPASDNGSSLNGNQTSPHELPRYPFGRKQQRYSSQEIRSEWVGDAALLMLTRLVISERYPHMSVLGLHAAVNHCVSNNVLLRAGGMLHIRGGAEGVERHIFELITTNFAAAKRLVASIIQLASNLNWKELDEEDNRARQWLSEHERPTQPVPPRREPSDGRKYHVTNR